MSKTNNDAIIKVLMEKLEEKKSFLGPKPRKVLKTNGLFKREGERININTVSNPITLAGALGFLIAQETAFKEACSRLSVNGEFLWDGYSVSDWEEDFRDRIAVIEYEKQKKSIEENKSKLASLVSEEAKTEMELEKIKKSLGL